MSTNTGNSDGRVAERLGRSPSLSAVFCRPFSLDFSDLAFGRMPRVRAEQMVRFWCSLHGKDELTLVVRDFVHPRQQGIVPRAVVADGERLDHGPPFGVDDARHMAALGDVDANDEHKQTPSCQNLQTVLALL